jgi:hypothetical protein
VWHRGIFAGMILWSVCVIAVRGQQADSLLLKNDRYILELDSILASGDSANFLLLIDSLINVPEPALKSQLVTRLGYNSNVVANSRTLGINQFGLAPGIAYYHKSGLYADATGYWSKNYEPNYYLTVVSAGYLKSITPWWALMAEYGHFFYSETGDLVSIPYKDNIGLYNFFDVKNFTFRFDYQFYFGEKQAHRIAPSVMYNFQKRNLGKISRISFFPTIAVLMGSEQISQYVPYANTLAGALIRIRRGLPLYYEEITTEFGVLNYSLVAPVSITVKSWFFMISYTYNIPKALPGENLELTNAGYISATLSKRIQF